MSNLKLYRHALSGHAHRAELLLSLLGLDVELVDVDLAGGAHKSEAFLALNPFGQVPSIVDGANAISDSNAILVYLARKYAPTFLPDDPIGEAEVQKFLSLAAGEIAFGPAAARLINVFQADLDRDFAHSISAKVLGKLESALEGNDFLVGNKPSIADVAVYSYVAHAPEGDISLEPYPNVRRHLHNIESLDGFVPFKATPVGLAAK